jgi:hypothetical protein
VSRINSSEAQFLLQVSFTHLLHRSATKNVDLLSEDAEKPRGQSFSAVLPQGKMSDLNQSDRSQSQNISK